MGNIGMAAGITATGLALAGTTAAALTPYSSKVPAEAHGAAVGIAPSAMTGVLAYTTLTGAGSSTLSKLGAGAAGVAAAALVMGAAIVGASLAHD